MKRIALGAGVLVVLLVVAQVVLPVLAERYVRSQVGGDGAVVESVDVAAFPAVKLLLHRADRITLRLRAARLGAGDLVRQLQRAKGVGRIDATVGRLDLGPLPLTGIEVHKRGRRLTGEASVTRRALASALPAGVGLGSLEARGGSLVLQATAGPLAVRARLSAVDGALRIAPDGVLGGLLSLTVFQDPRVSVTGVGARPRADGFTLTAVGRLA